MNSLQIERNLVNVTNYVHKSTLFGREGDPLRLDDSLRLKQNGGPWLIDVRDIDVRRQFLLKGGRIGHEDGSPRETRQHLSYSVLTYTMSRGEIEPVYFCTMLYE